MAAFRFNEGQKLQRGKLCKEVLIFVSAWMAVAEGTMMICVIKGDPDVGRAHFAGERPILEGDLPVFQSVEKSREYLFCYTFKNHVIYLQPCVAGCCILWILLSCSLYFLWLCFFCNLARMEENAKAGGGFTVLVHGVLFIFKGSC